MAKIETEYPYIISIEKAAKIFGLGEHTIRHHLKTDLTFPKILVGSHAKINSGLFKEWIDKATKEGRQL